MIRKIIVNLSLNKVGFELMCYICMYIFLKWYTITLYCYCTMFGYLVTKSLFWKKKQNRKKDYNHYSNNFVMKCFFLLEYVSNYKLFLIIYIFNNKYMYIKKKIKNDQSILKYHLKSICITSVFFIIITYYVWLLNWWFCHWLCWDL